MSLMPALPAFTHCSGVSIIDFKEVNGSWEAADLSVNPFMHNVDKWSNINNNQFYSSSMNLKWFLCLREKKKKS